MKIRWNSQSVRWRISPSELAALQRGDSVEETLSVGAGVAWCARLQIGAATRLDGEAALVTLTLSREDCAQLGEAEREGVYFNADGFRYFVEKDFPCAHPRAAEAMEPPGETFAAPPGFEERKGPGRGAAN